MSDSKSYVNDTSKSNAAQQASMNQKIGPSNPSGMVAVPFTAINPAGSQGTKGETRKSGY